jgi:predicted SAM-dependent methyltransferase
MAFKKSLFEKIGPFDESLWPCCGEEIDFCLRSREKCYRVGIAQDVYVHHFGSQTFAEMGLDYKEIGDRNDKYLSERWGNDFWNRQAAISKNGGIRLNLGSGPFPLPGFINIDQFENVKPDLVCDVLSLPYEPETVSEIYAGHILEHFRFDDGMKALRYWHSILCHGGTISVSTPDFDFLARKYLSDPSPERLMNFNDTYIYSGLQPSPHQYAYSAALLKKVMEDAGFVNLTVMPVNHPYFPHIVDWQIGYTGFKP